MTQLSPSKSKDAIMASMDNLVTENMRYEDLVAQTEPIEEFRRAEIAAGRANETKSRNRPLGPAKSNNTCQGGNSRALTVKKNVSYYNITQGGDVVSTGSTPSHYYSKSKISSRLNHLYKILKRTRARNDELYCSLSTLPPKAYHYHGSSKK